MRKFLPRNCFVIKFVADMGKAMKFYRDVLGLGLKFESPGWSEFVTGKTNLALHPASETNPAGKVELGMVVVQGCYTLLIHGERIAVKAGEEYFIWNQNDPRIRRPSG